MMESWKEVYLRDYYTISSGLSRPAKDFGSGYPFLSFKDIFHNFFVPKELNELVESNSEDQTKYSIKKGDVFLTRTSEKVEELGLSSVALKDYPNATFNGFTKRLRPNDKNNIDPVFIGFYLRSPQFRAEITAYSSLTTRASLNNGIINRLKIKLPSLKTQRKIATILSGYDDLIENNLKRIKLLEEKARLTYEEWFVRMKFPGHESVAINKETSLPEGWKKIKLKDSCNLTMGQSPKSKYYNEEEEGLPFHQGVRDYGFRFPENSIWSTEGNRIAEANDILFSVRAPVGRLNVAYEKMILGRGLAGINHKSGLTSFVFYQLQNLFYEDNLMGGGAIFNSITKKDLEGVKLLFATDELNQKFNVFANNIDKLIKNLTRQNQLLKEARDILLPRLMTGMIEVEKLDLEELKEQPLDMVAEEKSEYQTNQS
ncbi:restriction endonuclease subunit S [Salegentibacter mishustinae]|uniref:restriction endonuclease subunit S n=1 Tax=Salegentibacter mishustinae TaxID=270918 RepID=UPI002492E903|nr:restriction endonuclease subunit S [Salegentibacter mishustinae]